MPTIWEQDKERALKDGKSEEDAIRVADDAAARRVLVTTGIDVSEGSTTTGGCFTTIAFGLIIGAKALGIIVDHEIAKNNAPLELDLNVAKVALHVTQDPGMVRVESEFEASAPLSINRMSLR